MKEAHLNIRVLDLNHNPLHDDSMLSLGELIQNSDILESLSLANTQITDVGVKTLIEHLVGNTTLKYLELHSNPGITNASVQHLSKLLQSSSIDLLAVFQTSIGERGKTLLEKLCSEPLDKREIPISSNSKSASKTS